MCNACGFFCCGSDQFSGCGCEHCDNPECWPDEEDEFGDDDDYGPDDAPERPAASPGKRAEG